jgi:glycosyltransferase involved in cell wall biosynthesis
VERRGNQEGTERLIRQTESSFSRGRICFYSPFLYPIAAEGEVEFVGGAEVQQWALARALATRGFDVTIATCDFGQEPVVKHEGVTLLKTYSMQAGIPGVRLFYPRLWKAMRTLRKANADVYLANGSGAPAGWAYHASRIRGSKFVFLAASDGDAVPSLPWLTRRRERWWYLQALQGADARVAQTDLQRDLFRQNFGLEAEVIPNPAELNTSPVDAGANNSVLWLSTYKPSKRPEWFTELARRLPHIRFVMVGLPGSGRAAESWQAARRAAAAMSNLEVHGFVPHARVKEFLRSAALFVHTSPAEGFPMTLLESWSHGIPAVTTLDPGGTIARHKIGAVATDIDGLVDAVVSMMSAPTERSALGARARRYVEEHHGPEKTYEPLATLLDRVIRDRSASSSTMR